MEDCINNQHKFTVVEILKWLEQQDSFGDVFYNLSEKKIIEANETEEENEV